MNKVRRSEETRDEKHSTNRTQKKHRVICYYIMMTIINISVEQLYTVDRHFFDLFFPLYFFFHLLQHIMVSRCLDLTFFFLSLCLLTSSRYSCSIYISIMIIYCVQFLIIYIHEFRNFSLHIKYTLFARTRGYSSF